MIVIRAMMVDDEMDSLRLLQVMLENYCPHIQVIGSYTNPSEAIMAIKQEQPDLLFLDVEMPEMNGFELIETIKPQLPSIVFITAYNQYAIRAFRSSALDYLLKPISKNDLVEAMAKVQKPTAMLHAQIDLFQEQLNQTKPTRLAIPAAGGTVFIDMKDIAYVEASKNYSKIMMIEKRSFTVIRSMKEIEDVLNNDIFLRIHRQYIVNLNYIKEMNRTESTILLQNGISLPVSRQQKEFFEMRFKWL